MTRSSGSKMRIVLLSLTVLSTLWCAIEMFIPNPSGLGSTVLIIVLIGSSVCLIASSFWYQARINVIKRQIQQKQEAERIITAFKKKTAILLAQKVDESGDIELEHWLHSLANPPWTDDSRTIEIEVEFIAPLLHHLGYKSNEVDSRAPVLAQEESEEAIGKADWVIKDENGDVLLIVEAKAPGKPLNEDAAKRARSHASRLGAPAYIATNGYQLQVFRRGASEDRCVVDWETTRLAEAWEAVRTAVGRENVRALGKG